MRFNHDANLILGVCRYGFEDGCSGGMETGNGNGEWRRLEIRAEVVRKTLRNKEGGGIHNMMVVDGG